MLIDVQYISKTRQLIASYVDEKGQIKLKYFPWEQPTQYEYCSADDPYVERETKSWDDKPVKKVTTDRPDRYAIYDFLDTVISKEEHDEIFKLNFPKLYFVDIEVEIRDGFPEASEALTPVTSLSIVYDNKIILMGLKDLSEEQQQRIIKNTHEHLGKAGINKKYEFKYIKYDCEFDMLYHFFHNLVPKMELITGWNFIKFDWTYLMNRAKKIEKNNGGRILKINTKLASPTRQIEKVWMSEEELPKHRMVFDYMMLYEIVDTSIKVRESSALDFVATKTLGVPKIHYPGSLKDLYDNDFETFMLYNAIDSALVQLIHEKMHYISVVFAISSLAKIKLADCINMLTSKLSSLPITEGVLRNRFRQEGKVLFKDRDKQTSPGQGIDGGWVKDPNVGMNQWVSCYDFSSLYPSVERQFFISPENFRGHEDSNYEIIVEYLKGSMEEVKERFDDYYQHIKFKKKVEKSDKLYYVMSINTSKISIDKFKEIVEGYFEIKKINRYFINHDTGERNLVNLDTHVVCVNKTVFLKRKSPTIRMLEEVYAERKVNKKKMMDAKTKMKELERKLEEVRA